MALKNRSKVSQMADRYARQGKLKEAILEYRKLLEDSPSDVGILNKIGDLHLRAGEPERALDSFTRIAEHYRDRGFSQKAVAMYKKIAKLDRGGVEAREQLAALYAEQGLTREALRSLREASDLCSEQGDSERGLELETRALELVPEDGNGQQRLARKLREAGQTERALATFLRGAEGMMAAGERDAAVDCIRECIAMAPLDPAPIRFLCRSLFDSGDEEQATTEVEALLQEDHDRPHLLALLGEAKLRQGDPDSARGLLERARGDAGMQADVHFLASLARLQLRDGHEGEALEQVERALAILDNEGRRDEALQIVRECLATCPTSECLTDLLLERGLRGTPERPQTEAALELLARLLPQAGREERLPSVLYHLALCRPDDSQLRQELARLGVDPDGPPPEPLPDAGAGGAPAQPAAADGDIDDEFVAEHLTEADVFIKYKLLPRAAEHLRSILQRYPHTIVAHQRLIELYQEMGERPAAVSQFMALAVSYVHRNSTSDADRVLKEATNVDPHNRDLAALRAALAAGDPLPAVTPVVPVPPERAPEAEPAPAAAPLPSPPPSGKAATPADVVLDEEVVEIELEGALLEMPADESVPEADVLQVSGGAKAVLDEDGEDFFDLAGALEAEIAEETRGATEVTPVVDDTDGDQDGDPVDGIRRAIQDQVGDEDHQTHYQLGIAFKEMGMLDQAIGEFQQASRNPETYFACCSMLGMCFREKSMPQIAEKWYRQGLERSATSTRDTEQRLGLLYDLGELLVERGELAEAHTCFTEVYTFDVNYRDVSQRVEEIGARLSETRPVGN